MSKSTVFTFSVDSALLRELGEKLVSTVHVALAELVKNAYDADATEVRISIKPNPTGGPTIVIEDTATRGTTGSILMQIVVGVLVARTIPNCFPSRPLLSRRMRLVYC